MLDLRDDPKAVSTLELADGANYPTTFHYPTVAQPHSGLWLSHSPVLQLPFILDPRKTFLIQDTEVCPREHPIFLLERSLLHYPTTILRQMPTWRCITEHRGLGARPGRVSTSKLQEWDGHQMDTACETLQLDAQESTPFR